MPTRVSYQPKLEIGLHEYQPKLDIGLQEYQPKLEIDLQEYQPRPAYQTQRNNGEQCYRRRIYRWYSGKLASKAV